jgi:hypothetical protein
MAKFTEARLIDRAGKVVSVTSVVRPFPPTMAWMPEAKHEPAFTLRVADLTPLPLPHYFDRIGVEVDRTGTWVRYEERS